MSLRVIDSGLRSARENLSLTEALAQGRRAGASPDTLRFQHFPRSAIIGRRQLLAAEVDLDWTRAQGVETARRMTGGGAIVMGPGILGWELIVGRARVPAALADIAATICAGVADGLRALGLDAAFRPRNDVEVEGRKVCGTGGYFDGDILVFQGTVLVELDRELLAHALRLPAHKLGKRGLAALGERVADLAGLLGAAPPMARVQDALAEGVAAALGLVAQAGDVSAQEEATARAIFADDIGTDVFVHGLDDMLPREGRIVTGARDAAGGRVEAVVKLRDGGVIEQALIVGDFFSTTPRLIADVEAHLRQIPLAEAARAAQDFLEARGAGFLGLTAADIAAALADAARAVGEADA